MALHCGDGVQLRSAVGPATVGMLLLWALFVGSTRLAALAQQSQGTEVASGLGALPPSVVDGQALAHAAAADEAAAAEASPGSVVESALNPGGDAVDRAAIESTLVSAMAGREFAFLPMKMTLTDASGALADDIAAALASEGGDWRLRVRVHAHTWGSRERNAEVSERRAEILRERLLAAGLADMRLRVEGVGDAVPVANLWTPEGRRQGRRIEVHLDWQGE